MNESESFFSSIYLDQERLAKRESPAFIGAVLGPKQARPSVED